MHERSARRRTSLLLALLAAVLLGGCGYRYPVPDAAPLSTSPVLTASERIEFETMRPATDASGLEPVSIPAPDPNIGLPEAGDKMYEARIPVEMAAGLRAFLAKDYAAAMKMYDAMEANHADPYLRYIAALLRMQALMATARPGEAERVFETVNAREIAIFGNNWGALMRLAELRLWTGEYDAAIALSARVRQGLGAWKIPTFYFWPPANVRAMGHFWTAKLRSALILSTAYLLKGEDALSMAWARIGHEQLETALWIMDHPLYGLFAKPNAAFYILNGWELAILAGARVAVTGRAEAGAELFAAANYFFAAAGYVDGALLVDGIRDYVAVRRGLKETLTRRIGVIPERRRGGRAKAILRSRPGTVGRRESVMLPVPAEGSVRLPHAGERTPYGFTATEAIERAGKAFLKGDGDAALAALDAARAEARDARQRWYVSYLHAQTLIMMGRAADAEAELARTERIEVEAFGTNVNARALRGEARMWLGDYDAAEGDFADVVNAIGDWRVPTLFVFPPPDIPAVAALARAHLRAYLGMAGVLMFKGEYADAWKWAEEAEKLFEELFYDVHHALYSRYTAVDADMYYGRGINLGILGAARMGATGDAAASDATFDAANAYFDAMGYAVGKATVDALRVRVLLGMDRAEAAAPLARRAAADATRKGLADLVWQIEALRGEALLDLGRAAEAEGAFRRAQAAVAVISGALASDRAKRRFGVGKDGITARLIAIDVAKGDWPALFRDLEEGRARAFVDMLARRPVAVGREPEAVAAINAVDAEIRRLRLANAAPGGATAEGVAAEARALDHRAALVRALRARDPELADVMSIATRSLADIQGRLGPGDVMVYALPVRDGTIRFLVVTKAGARLAEAAMTADALDDAIEVFHTDQPFDDVAGQRLAARDIVDGLGVSGWGAVRTLYVVPSGGLYFVPWGALDLPYPVVQLPTGGWLDRRPKVSEPRRRAAVVGDPALGPGLPPLPGARQEAATVARQYGVKARIGALATPANLRRDVGDGVEVLHLAAHGVFDPKRPLQSAIMLSDGRRPRHLTAADIFERPLTARLVVLSACETGGGTATAGDDFLGLARSFYIGGAVSLVNSLWPVFDRPTRLFMETFHSEARSGDFGRAWVRARDALKAKGFPPSVYGAFVLGGAAGL